MQNAKTTLAAVPSLALCLLACPPDDTAGGSGTGGRAPTTSGLGTDDHHGPWFETTLIDTTPPDPVDPCTDDYDGNHELASAHLLAIDTTHTVQTVLGDHVVSRNGPEQGSDRLVACPGHPDFFTIEPACAGFLGVDLRRLDGGRLDLHLHDADGQALDQSLGTWHGFFLKPLHRRIDAQPHTIEVRHAGGRPAPYTMEVYFLPAPSCP